MNSCHIPILWGAAQHLDLNLFPGEDSVSHLGQAIALERGWWAGVELELAGDLPDELFVSFRYTGMDVGGYCIRTTKAGAPLIVGPASFSRLALWLPATSNPPGAEAVPWLIEGGYDLQCAVNVSGRRGECWLRASVVQLGFKVLVDAVDRARTEEADHKPARAVVLEGTPDQIAAMLWRKFG